MTEPNPRKVTFLGPEWIDAAREILQEVVSRHGKPGETFSMCECFSGAPSDIAPSGVAAWHFRIDGTSVEVGTGEIDDATMKVRAGYEEILPLARSVYTPEIIAEQRAKVERGDYMISGDPSSSPSYLRDLHNRLAVLTA